MIISADKGRQNKIHVSIDGEYRFTVDADFWFSCGLISGDEIDEERLEDLTEKVKRRRCFNRAMNILSRRDHCRKELYQKLRREDGDDAAEHAVQRAVELGLIDDEKYAETLAAELRDRKGMSAKGIRSELMRRGVDRDTAENAVSLLSNEDDYDKIVELIGKKYGRQISDEKGRSRAINAMTRLGYPYSLIRQALDDLLDEYEQD